MERRWCVVAAAALALLGRADAAVISGKVGFKGTPPAAKPIKMSADPKCQALHAKPLSTDYVVVNANGTLKNAFVYIKEGLAGKTFTPPAAPVVFDQRGCVYAPHVFGIMAGQPLEILNSDPTLHNVHAMPKENPQFNIGMPVPKMKITRKFEKPEMGVKIKCDVHPWMSAYANVMSHPFYAVTGDDGSFTLKEVPDGSYTLGLWHEKYGAQEGKVTVAGGKDASLEFTVEGTREAGEAK